MRVKEALSKDEYDMPDLPAVHRALRGEVILLDKGIAQAIQDEVDELRNAFTPLSQEELEKIRSWKDPATWNKCMQALRPLVAELLLRTGNHATMQQIREASLNHPFLRKYMNSIGQRVRDLVKEEFLGHIYKDGKMVPGHYCKGTRFVETIRR